MSLEMIKRKSGMNTLYWRLKYSLDEIQEKHPERLDIIGPMEESMKEVAAVVEYLTHCEKVYQATERRSHRLELENLQLKQENRSLSEHLKTLISGEI
jgi:predicted nuclease with TOPRIM domain